jgi:hypothetical protein
MTQNNEINFQNGANNFQNGNMDVMIATVSVVPYS